MARRMTLTRTRLNDSVVGSFKINYLYGKIYHELL